MRSSSTRVLTRLRESEYDFRTSVAKLLMLSRAHRCAPCFNPARQFPLRGWDATSPRIPQFLVGLFEFCTPLSVPRAYALAGCCKTVLIQRFPVWFEACVRF